MSFEIGDKVVCIDDKFEDWLKNLYACLPVEGQTYVIRDVRLGASFVEGKRVGAVSVLLVGMINPGAEGKTGSLAERGFNSDRFRKLDEMKAENQNQQPQVDAVARPQEAELEKVEV